MNTCDTCQHWKRPQYDYEGIIDPLDPDTYQPMKMPFEVRYCEHPRLMTFERPLEPDQASCIDGSDFRAVLATGPKFGCIHHEPTP